MNQRPLIRALILGFAIAAPLALILLWPMSPLAGDRRARAVARCCCSIPTLRPNVQWLGPVITHFATSRKEVWLTIDDGPTEDTRAVLDLFDRHGVKATFFVKGVLAETAPGRSFERSSRAGTRSPITRTRIPPAASGARRRDASPGDRSLQSRARDVTGSGAALVPRAGRDARTPPCIRRSRDAACASSAGPRAASTPSSRDSGTDPRAHPPPPLPRRDHRPAPGPRALAARARARDRCAEGARVRVRDSGRRAVALGLFARLGTRAAHCHHAGPHSSRTSNKDLR